MIKQKDIELLVSFFGFYNDDVNGRTRIQKDICILKYEEKINFNFEFEPHYYGPYSSELTDTVDTLVASGLLEEKIEVLPSGILRYDYGLTHEGKSMFSVIQSKLEKENIEELTKIKETIKALKGRPIAEVISLAKACSGMQSTI